MGMLKDFTAETYIIDQNLVDTLTWLCHHQGCFDSFEYDAFTKVLSVHHANGTDILREGMFLNAKYGLLITSL